MRLLAGGQYQHEANHHPAGSRLHEGLLILTIANRTTRTTATIAPTINNGCTLCSSPAAAGGVAARVGSAVPPGISGGVDAAGAAFNTAGTSVDIDVAIGVGVKAAVALAVVVGEIVDVGVMAVVGLNRVVVVMDGVESPARCAVPFPGELA